MPEQLLTAAAVGMLVGLAMFSLLMRYYRRGVDRGTIVAASQDATRAQASSSQGNTLGQSIQALAGQGHTPISQIDARIARDVEDLVGQLDLLVKEIEASVASRMAQLDIAMKEADDRIQLLRAASQGLTGQAHNDSAAAPPLSRYEGQSSEAIAGDDATDEDEVVTLPGTWPLPPKARPGADEGAPPHAGTKLRSPRHAEVLRLHRQGKDMTDIARRLQMEVGEVELVLNLHRAR